MTEEARAEWLAVAWNTLGHLPADLLARGARKARETSDHPSKIVPAILRETQDMLDWRREHRALTPPPQITGPRPPRSIDQLMRDRGQPMTEAETEAMNKHLEWGGSPFRYAQDGTRFRLEA